jgi:hypothetical protein
LGTIYEMKKPSRINAFSVSLVLVALALAYFLYFFIPVWWPVFQLTGIMKGVCNDAYHTHDDKKLMDKLLAEAKRTRLRLTEENFLLERERYTPEELNAMSISDSARALLERRGKVCRISLGYTSEAKLPFTQKVVEIPWNRSVETDLAVIKY